MFGIFKKKKEAPVPNPEAEKMAERVNTKTQIAELQSQISELRRQSVQMNSEIARKVGEREQLMAEIRKASPAQKTALAIRVKNLDKLVSGLNGNLSLVEQQIGNIEAKILEIGATIVIDTGDSESVVKAENHQKKLQEAAEIKKAGDINAGIAAEMHAALTGGATIISDDIAGILAEAEGTGQTVPSESIATHTPDYTQSSHPMPTSQL